VSRPVPHPAADRCPGLLRAHRAEDGSLVRIRIPGGQTDAATVRALSDLSQAYGNGDLQLTSRGNVQIRGIDERRLTRLSDAVGELGLLPSAEHERVRNVVASPLTGLGGHLDLRDVVAELDQRICASTVLGQLPGRFLFALDAGRGDALSLSYDLGYLATDETQGLIVAGGRGLRVTRATAARELVRWAERFLAARATLGRPVWHVRELPWPLLAKAPAVELPVGGPVALGVVEEAASVGVPLAMLTPDQARTVADVATSVVVTPWRGLVLPKANERLPELLAAGLVVEPRSPWASLSACVGAPGCAKSLISTRDRAVELAGAWPSPSLPVHVSGCRRRCGAPSGRYVDLMAPASLGQSLAVLDAIGPDGEAPDVRRPSPRYDYVSDGGAIYARSFATIRDEADLGAFAADVRPVVVRMIHAAGDVDLVQDVAVHGDLVTAARTALADHATIFTDSEMLASGITRRRLPADNAVRCLLNDTRTTALAEQWRTTRSAAAVSLWGPELEGAVVAIGNAPTALFHLLELIADGGPRPAAIIGIPVGFVGSAESKLALAQNPWDIPYLVVHGRRGGSAICAAAVNALASPSER
jgi:precorrin isomerase/dissimilatory sulfite reductase (desulfoviridin) alpha/beta subunit